MRNSFTPIGLARGSFYLSFAFVADYLALLVFNIVAPRLLSQSEVGSLSLLFFSIAVFNTLTLLAINQAVIKYLAEYMGVGEPGLASAVSNKAYRAILVVSIPAFSLVIIIIAILNPANSLALIFALSTGFLLNLTNYYGAVMLGLGLYREVSIQNIVYATFARCLALFAAFLGMGIVGVALGYLFGAILCLLFSIRVVRNKLPEPRESYPAKALLEYSAPLYLNNIISLSLVWIDLIILQLLIQSLPLTGVYYLVTTGAGVLGILWMPISMALFPAMSGNPREQKQMATSALRIINVLVIPASLSLALIAPTAVTVAYGEAYRFGASAFSIVIAGSFFAAYSSIFTTSLQAGGRTKEVAVIGGVAVLLGSGIAAVLASPLRLVGIAIARISMVIISFALGYMAAKKMMGLKLDTGSIYRAAAVAALVGVALLAIDTMLRRMGMNLALIAIIEILAFPVLIYFSKPVCRPEIEQIQGIVVKIFLSIGSKIRQGNR